jgi:DNA-binding NarL/FixJ family response regulator
MNAAINNNPISVLIVEDEIIIAMEAETELQSRGFNVIGSVPSSEQAVDAAVMYRPNVILMDIHIQGSRDGIESSLEIFNTYKPVIIFISAYDDDETREKIGTVQPNYFLPKPIVYDELMSVIRESVSNQQSASAENPKAMGAARVPPNSSR